MTEELKVEPEVVENKVVEAAVKPKPKTRGKAKAKAPTEKQLQEARELIAADKAANAGIAHDDRFINWSIPIKRRTDNNEVIIEEGSYELAPFLNRLESILNNRGAKFTYNAEDSSIVIKGMYNYVTQVSLQAPQKDILKVCSNIPMLLGYVGGKHEYI